MEHIGELSQLHGLALMNSHITDSGLKHLEGLRNLKWLNLNFTNFTNAGLEPLASAPARVIDDLKR
jgi:internalin A